MEDKDLETTVNDLEKKIDRLMSLYNQYFMGIEKIEPSVQKKNVERIIHDLRKERIKHTGIRFKFQTMIQRYNTLQTYWIRVCRQIEEGTYRRDVLRAQKRIEEHGRETAQTKTVDKAAPPATFMPETSTALLEDMDDPFGVSRGKPAQSDMDLDDPFAADRAKARDTAPTTKNRVTQPEVAAPSFVPDEDRLKAVYKAFLTARQKTGESIASLSFDKVKKTLAEQAKSYSEKHGNATVDFQVHIREGKAVFKAVLKDKPS